MNTPESAPKDETFLGNFGYPWLQMTVWNDYDKKWSVASMEINMMNGEWNDPYWTTEQENETALLGWIPLPPITPTTTQP